MLKRYAHYVRRYGAALLRHHVELTAIMAALALIIVAAAAAMYRVEAGHGTFPTFWSAIYWATTTVTTVGYGDFVPATTAGQVVAVLTSIVGAGFLVLTAGILAASFVRAMDKPPRQT